jgi:hypothetical protein
MGEREVSWMGFADGPDLGKYVAIASDEVESVPSLAGMDQGVEKAQPDDVTARSVEENHGLATPDERANAMVGDIDKSVRNSASPSARRLVDPAEEKLGRETAAGITALMAAQESSLVRSALRMNSLDGEDAALLSEFLSRAQAKRAANAAMVPKDAQRLVEETMTPDSPTVPSRRALEELDKNSPSPQKAQVSTPVKADKKAADAPADRPTENADTQPVSPTLCRRSNRTKPHQSQQQRASSGPTLPNQIPVRRANGTEFVFLQRTEAQELALATRRNTRRNKGDAQLPKHALQVLSKEEQTGTRASPSTPNREETVTQSLRRSPRKHPGSKQVTWNEVKLAEYADEQDKDPEAVDDIPSPSKKKASTAKNHSKKCSSEKQGADTSMPGTPSRKVKRLALPAPTSSTSVPKPMPAGTPIPKRKKLVPKSPGTSLLTAPAKTATTKSISSSTAKPTPKVPASSTTRHKKASGIPKIQSLLKAASSSSSTTSSAGATPMVKRVRAKRAV